MTFAELYGRPPAATGEKYLAQTAGEIMAEMFAMPAGAVRLPRGFGGKAGGVPMRDRWQGVFRELANERRLEAFSARQAKRRAPRQHPAAKRLARAS